MILIIIIGTLVSVDQYLNVKLTNVNVVDSDRYPHFAAMKNCFIRGKFYSNSIMTSIICILIGSVVRYIQIAACDVDVEILQDATRKENSAKS